MYVICITGNPSIHAAQQQRVAVTEWESSWKTGVFAFMEGQYKASGGYLSLR